MTMLERYHLHYLDDLTTTAALAQPASVEWLVERWVRLHGKAMGPAWHAYPTSRRLVNLCKWILAGGTGSRAVERALGAHADLILRRPEYDVRANHLLANAVALIFAGETIAGDLGRRSRAAGAAILREQIRTQILADGGHYERSPMYHAIVLEDLLDARNVLGRDDLEISRLIDATVPGMLHWLDVLTLPDGRIAQMNDSAFYESQDLLHLKEYAFQVSRTSALDRSSGSITHLPQSGFVRIDADRWTLIADVGSLGPAEQLGHAHAGTLSFELAVKAQRLLVNAGISTYERDRLRLEQRATRAHNTVELDQRDSSEVWAAFRVGRRAEVVFAGASSEGGRAGFSAEHNGFAHLAGRPKHRRTWTMGADALELLDQIDSKGRHEVAGRLHVHPDFRVACVAPLEAVVTDRTGRELLAVDAGDWASLSIEPYGYAAGFGQLLRGSCVVLRSRTTGPTSLRCVLRCHRDA